MKKLEAIKLIRKELIQPFGKNGVDFTDWSLIETLSKKFGLQDTSYREKIVRREKEGLLQDYLLDLGYWRKQLTNEK